MKFTSAWAMPSRYGCLFLTLIFWLAGFGPVRAVVLERVMALVGDTPVFYSEFLEFRQMMKEQGTYRSDAQTLDDLIDRTLLELEARRLRLDAGVSDEGALVERYLELAVRGFLIHARHRGQMADGEKGGSRPRGQETPGDLGSDEAAGEEDPEVTEFKHALDKKLSELRSRFEVRIVQYE